MYLLASLILLLPQSLLTAKLVGTSDASVLPRLAQRVFVVFSLDRWRIVSRQTERKGSIPYPLPSLVHSLMEGSLSCARLGAVLLGAMCVLLY